MKLPYRLKKRGNTWYVKFAHDQHFHSTGMTNRHDAVVFANRECRKLLSLAKEGPTFTEYARDFFLWDQCKWVRRQREKKRPFSKAVAKSRRGHLNNYLLPKFGKRKLSSITAFEIEDWLVTLTLANQTRNHILYTLSTVLREAKREGVIDRNPAEDVEPMGKDFQPTSAPSDEELVELPRFCRHFWATSCFCSIVVEFLPVFTDGSLSGWYFSLISDVLLMRVVMRLVTRSRSR